MQHVHNSSSLLVNSSYTLFLGCSPAIHFRETLEHKKLQGKKIYRFATHFEKS